jgi:hypothetical protein
MDEAPLAPLVGKLVAAFAVRKEISTSELKVELDDNGWMPKPGELQEALGWLEQSAIIEQVGLERWRMTPDLSEILCPHWRLDGANESALAEIADWGRATVGSPNALDAIEAARSGEYVLPSAVQDALSRLEAVRGDRRPSRYGLTEAFAELAGSDRRAFEVYRRRRCGETPRPTLGELGDELGLTRERVRQLSERVAARIDATVKGNPDNPIWTAAQRLRSTMGAVWPMARLDEALAEAGPQLGAISSDGFRKGLLLELAGPYTAEKGWFYLSESQAAIEAVVASLTPIAPVALDQLLERLASLSASENIAREWLLARPDTRVSDGRVVRWGSNLGDKAVAILALRGEPMTAEEIYESLGEDRSERSFKQRVQSDERIRRLGVKHYGLELWGGEEYSSIAEEMAEEIERCGGRVELETLASRLSERFGVAETSVRMYASGAQFLIDNENMVRLNTGDAAAPDVRPLALAKNCYRTARGWAFRREVDSDVLRGSGTGLPRAFALEVGLSPGGRVELHSPHGQIRAWWPHHMAHIGTLRAVAEALDAEEGDFLFIVAVDEGAVDFHCLRRTEREQLDGAERLALECTGERSDDPLALVAKAVGIAPDPREGLSARVRQRLIERHEEHLARLIQDRGGTDLLDIVDGI